LRTHKGSDGSSFKDRIEKYALWGGAIYETILYHGEDVSPLKTFFEWLIDEGYEDKVN